MRRRETRRTAVIVAVFAIASIAPHASAVPGASSKNGDLPHVSSTGSSAAAASELEDRVTALESLIGRSRLGAWIDFVYSDSDQTNSDPFFDPRHFYLYLDNRLNDRWQGFAELEIEHAPKAKGGNTSGEIKLERLYIQYNADDLLHLRGGKYNTEWGYWTPIHWAINVDTIQKPIHEDNQYVPAKSVGLEAFGSWFPVLRDGFDTEIRYTAYLSNGSESFGTNQPQDGRLGWGGDLRALVDERFLLGVSVYQQRNPSPEIGTPGRLESNTAVFADLQVLPNLTLRGEYMHQERSKGDPDIDVWYAKIKLDFLDKAYINYRFNSGDDDRQGDGGLHRAHTLTLGYWPLPEVRFKLEFTHNDFRRAGVEDFNAWGAFVGLIF